jgi:hypothetical protein
MTEALDLEEGGGHYAQAPPPPQQQAPQVDQQAQQPEQQEPVAAPQPEQQAPVADQQPAPPQAPRASTSFWMGPDWTDAEQEKVRAARGKVLNGIGKLGSGLAGAATATAAYLKADTVQDDTEAEDQDKLAGWFTFTGAVVAMSVAMTGIHDIYDGLWSWRALIRAHEARLRAEAPHNPQAQQVLAAADAVDNALPHLHAVAQNLGEEQQNLEQQQNLPHQ